MPPELPKPAEIGSPKGPAPSPPGSYAIKPISRPAFTLVEILITIAVLAFGCLAVLLMQSSALRGNTLADNLTVATFLAGSELERIKSLSRENLEEEIDLAPMAVHYVNRLGQICPNADPDDCKNFPFTRTLTFYQKKPTTFSNQAEVEVAWIDNSGPHRVLSSTIITFFTF
jgi:prepilin-type N-terminal cleavage/methylation domain-containing protein